MNNRQVKNALWASLLGGLIWLVWQRSHKLDKDKQTKHKVARLEQAQDKPHYGHILLFYRPKLVRDIFIQIMTGSRVYHCALYNGEKDGEPCVLEARPKGVIENSLKGREGVYIIVPAPRDKGEQALAWAKTQLGMSYDYMDGFVIGLEHVFKHWHINYTLPGKYTCGELVGAAFEHAGVHLVPGKHPSEIAPGDIARALAEKKYK